MSSPQLATHQHGKSRVRLGRVWREGDVHHMVEWSVDTMLESAMEHAYLTESNAGMTATDTQKNTVYYIAKQCSSRCSMEEFAVALGKHFVQTYPLVSKAKIAVSQANWERASVMGEAHNHGFKATGPGTRTTFVVVDEQLNASVSSGIKGCRVLKTTQSGYAGFLKDQFTLLPDTNERICATEITATWRYTSTPPSYDAAFQSVLTALFEAFYGPPSTGVYSPSVQYTLFQMGKLALERTAQVDSIYLNLPNLHFIPCKPVTSTFEDDVYVATSEPHGNIEATVTRGAIEPHAKL